jgi:DNA-binding CsgD family transcriptional regulator
VIATRPTPAYAVRRLQARGLTDSFDLLTDRENEVLQLVAEGRSNKEVATQLKVGLSTVETHRANLMQKLNLHSTAEIVLLQFGRELLRSGQRTCASVRWRHALCVGASHNFQVGKAEIVLLENAHE